MSTTTKRVETLTGRLYDGKDADAIVRLLRENSFTPTNSDNAYRVLFAARVRAIKPSAQIRTRSSRTFLADAVREGFLSFAEDGPKEEFPVLPPAVGDMPDGGAPLKEESGPNHPEIPGS
jgi:hypothetical protein